MQERASLYKTPFVYVFTSFNGRSGNDCRVVISKRSFVYLCQDSPVKFNKLEIMFEIIKCFMMFTGVLDFKESCIAK